MDWTETRCFFRRFLPVISGVGSKEMNKDAFTTALSRFILTMEQLADSTSEAEDKPLYEKFLSEATIIIAKVEQGRPIGNDVAAMERRFGHTWFKDKNAYNLIYSEWDTFKGLLRQSIHGMTVNERLFHLGLLDEFDSAVSVGDEPLLRAILFKCFLDNDNIEAIIIQQIKKKK